MVRVLNSGRGNDVKQLYDILDSQYVVVNMAISVCILSLRCLGSLQYGQGIENKIKICIKALYIRSISYLVSIL